MARVAVVTQARTGSTRLPGKVLLQAGGRAFLDHHLDRLHRTGLELVVATTTNPLDDPIAELAAARGVTVHRGSEHDVLARYAGAVRELGLDVVVRVTSDCPLIDSGVVTDAVAAWTSAEDPDLYLSNALVRTFPRGFDLEVFGGAHLLRADAQATAAHQREHVTPWLYESVGARLRNLARSEDRSAYRVTLDTVEDLALLRALIEEHDAHVLDCDGVVEVLDAHPELVAVNAHVGQKALRA
jgi:spore coat polysaccharide biosynthesis protein SpsF